MSTFVIAQETPAVHKINGKKYYLHVVEKGNTLYGISRQYAVTVEQIEGENSEALKEGLKENQTLLIPVTAENKKELGPVEQKQDFLIHRVQPKETLYSICKLYNSSLEDVLKANPDVAESGLKSDSEIKIPVKQIQVKAEVKAIAKPDSLKGHIVQKGETVYGISKLYNVNAEELNRVNNGFPIGLKEGAVIRVPVRPPMQQVKPVQSGKATPKVNDTLPKETLVRPKTLDSSGSYRIGIMLPMNPTFPDSSNQHNFKISEPSRVSLNFYRGFQYALDSLYRNYEVDIKVLLFHVSKDSGSLDRVLNDSSFKQVDVVVGPLYTDQFERVADRLKTRGVPVICPVPKPSKLLFKRPNTIKTTPSESMQLNSIAELLAKQYGDSNVILVNSNRFQDQENVEFFKTRYRSVMGVPDTFAGEVIKEVKFWEVNYETLRMRFPDSGKYTLMVPSSSPVFITSFISQLYNLVDRTDSMYQFRVIGMEDWRKLDEDIDIRHLHRLNVTIPVTSYVDMRDYKVSAFYRAYFSRFGYEPDGFTIQGFDLAHYLLEQLTFRPQEWMSKPEQTPYQGIVENYDFARVVPGSGVENRFVRLYEYKNYRLKPYANWPYRKSR
ncbi:MAG: LysM peptidoglycan-binding domain-containing protein [Flavobacteriales bacterium]